MTFIEENNENRGFPKSNEHNYGKNSSFVPKLLNLKFIISLLLMITVIITPFLVYWSVFDNIVIDDEENTCLVDSIYRLSCGKEDINSTVCASIYCCFDAQTNACYHSMPSEYYYNSEKLTPSLETTPLGLDSLENLKITVIEEYPKLRIILNAEESLQTELNPTSEFKVIENENDKISVSVFRKNSNEMLLTTVKGPLIASEDYLEWNLQLTNTSGVLFGLGQLKIDLEENSTLTNIIYKNKDDHNTLPNFMAYNNGKYHAVIIKHEGALEITVLSSYLISLRSIGGKKIELVLVDGPEPKDIYKSLIEEKASIPEWGLGVHLCRENEVEGLTALKDEYDSFIEKRSNYPSFTYDSHCVHDDLLLHLLSENCTTDDITKFFEDLKMTEKFVLSFPPQIPIKSKLFEQYQDTTLFYTNEKTGEFYQGKYKNFDVVYPKYEHSGIEDFLNYFQDLFGNIEIEGYTFTNSWPQDDSYQYTGDSDKPYIDQLTQTALSYTLPWDLKVDSDILHLQYHNEYGTKVQAIVNEIRNVAFSLSPVSDTSANGPLVIQSSIDVSWTNMKSYLVTSLYNSLFGHSLISAPICGSSSEYDMESNEDLCLRWYILAATMPLVRISSTGLSRDPISLYTTYTKNKVIEALQLRQSLIPFYRTIIMQGEPLIRPMFYEFPKDENVHTLDEQYMIGESILVAQPMTANIEIMSIYLPSDIVWYEIWGGIQYSTEKDDEWIKFPIVKSDWISFVMEGTIVPTVTYSDSEYSSIELIIAMNCTETCQATGTLMVESDNILVEFSALEETITIYSTDQNTADEIKNLVTKICFYKYTVSECESNDVQQYIN